MNVVTLLPSATEIVHALGMEESLVGVSHSCDYPGSIQDLPRVTSTRVPYTESSEVIDDFVRDHLAGTDALYELDMEALQTVAPDVIISQALCDVCAVSTGDVLAALDSLPSKPELIDIEPNTLNDVFDDCRRVGRALGVAKNATQLDRALRQRRFAVAEKTALIPMSDRPKVAFLEWLVPPFNGGHWNPELVALAGGIDVLGAPAKPSSTLDWDQVIAAQPDVVFIACCGFSQERALEDVRQIESENYWRQLPAVQNGRVYITDGNAYFARPGPRLLDGLEIMAHALHPDIHPVSPYGSCTTVS